MSKEIVQGILRHLLTGVGGALAVKYQIDGATIEAIVGGVVALVGVVWSIRAKRPNRHDRRTTP